MEGLYSKIIKAGERTYFVDVREARNKSRYLAITETKPSGDGEKKYSRSKVVVFTENMTEFRTAFDEASALMAQ